VMTITEIISYRWKTDHREGFIMNEWIYLLAEQKYNDDGTSKKVKPSLAGALKISNYNNTKMQRHEQTNKERQRTQTQHY